MAIQKIRKEVDQAVQIREDGKLLESRRLFEGALKKIKSLMRTTSKSDELKRLYVYCQGEFIIQNRLEAKKRLMEALEMGRKLYEFDQKNRLNEPASIRSVSNTMLDLGMFEEAIPYFEKLINAFKGNSGRQGDGLAHMAFCQLRVGKLKEAIKNLDLAIKKIKENTKKENARFVAVWLTHAMMVKGIVLNSRGKNSLALKIVKEALEIAKKNNATFRVNQAEIILKYLQSEQEKEASKVTSNKNYQNTR